LRQNKQSAIRYFDLINQNSIYTKATRINASLGIIGSSTLNEQEGNEIPLQPSKTKCIYELNNVQLKDGKFNFHLIKDWIVNLGVLKDNELIQYGENIKITPKVWNIELMCGMGRD